MTKTESMKTSITKPNSVFAIIGMIINCLIVFITILAILRLFIYQQVQVEGLSMYPNYDNKQYLLVNQLDKMFRRGQVVAVFANRDFSEQIATKMNPIQSYLARFDCQDSLNCKAKFYLKRVIGLPNEEIEIVGANVTIYNKENPKGVILDEKYIPDATKNSENEREYRMNRTKIPENEYFVMGDNRPNSSDSRVLGTFPSYSMFGQEAMRFYPFDSFHIFTLQEYVYK